MRGRPNISYNLYFIAPFLIWVVVGAILLLTQGDDTIFRFVNLHYSSFLDVLMKNSTVLGEGLFIAIVLLMLLAARSFRNWWYICTALMATVLPSVITQIVKRQIDAPRPLKHFSNADWIHFLPGWERLMEHSFPSGHTCGAFSFFAFLSMLLPKPYRILGLVFFFLSLLVGYSRIYLAVHFFSDIYIGSIIGTSVAILAAVLTNNFVPRVQKSKA